MIYEIYHGYRSPPFPFSENDFSVADAAKNGIWLYNMETQQNYQIRYLLVDTETEVSVNWEENELTLIGIDCPDSGCKFDLQEY